MRLRTPAPSIDILVIVLSLAGAFLVSQFAFAREQNVLAPFLVPPLIAADLDNMPLVPTLIKLLGLVLVSALAILLVRERRVSAELARTRMTLRTLIDTLPAGVLVADAHGTITLANPTANAILGQDAHRKHLRSRRSVRPPPSR